MEIYQNSFCKIIILFFVFSYCKTPQYHKLENCNILFDYHNIIDSINLNDTYSIFIRLNPNLRDYKNEIISDSEIFLIQKQKDHTFKKKPIEIKNRDDYPLKPISIASFLTEKEIYIYILNLAFFDQRSIEIYKLVNEALEFQSRIRTRNFKDLKSISISKNQEIIGIQKDTIFLLKSGKLKYVDIKISNIEKIKKIDQNYILIATKKKQIYLLTENFQIVHTLQFDLYPLDIFFWEDQFMILLSNEYLSKSNPNPSNLKSSKEFLYVISKNNFFRYQKFSIKSEFFTKFFITNNNLYTSLFYYPSQTFILHSWQSYSLECSINKDFFIHSR